MMELLYKTTVPLGTVHCISWSRMNLIALSVSVQMEGLVAKSYEGASTHQLLVFDPNRPWDFHIVACDYKSVVVHLYWSMEGTRLLALSKDGSIRVWRMKSNCANSWVCANKVESTSDGSLVHVGWLDYRPMMTIHHSKEDWTEVLEVQPFSPHLRMLLGNGFVSVSSSGKIRVTSTSLPHLRERGELTAEVQLPTSGKITIARTYVTQTGSILCSIGYENGQVKVFSVCVSLCWGAEFTLTATLATELHQMSTQSEEITDMLMLPLSDGCEVHLCYNRRQLYKWSVKDITRSGSYQSRREGSYSSTHPLSSLVGSGLCLGSHDQSVSENKMSELLVLGDDVLMKEGETHWPTEVVACGTVGGEVTLFSRESCKVLATEKGQVDNEDQGLPATKRRKLDQSESSSTDGCLVTISPNACCVCVAQGSHIVLYNTGKIILGLKDSSSPPEVPRCSRLLSLSLVSGQTSWDLAVTCARLEPEHGDDFVGKVLKNFSADFESNSSTLKNHLLQQYYSVCSLVQSCNEDGLLPALTYRRMSRLNATATLLALSLPTQRDEEKGLVERLEDVCDSSEEKLDELITVLDAKDFTLPPDVSSHLQGHCHWLIELAIKVVAALTTSQNDGTNRSVPEESCLKILKQCLVLVYLWNKDHAQPILPVTDGALSLLYKVITTHLQSPSTPFTDELQTEISTNIPIEKHPNLLSLSKAAHLQGFLSGLTSAQLPESFIRGKPCRIRPSVQSHYSSLDPYSPLSLVVPQGLSPPWRDCFIEGLKDIVHGGGLTKAVIQNARLKQCSRCRSWTVSSDGLQSDQSSLLSRTSHPVQQWRSAWTTTCLCGAPWTINNSKRT